MKFTLDDSQVPDGTVLLFGVRYVDSETGSRASSKVFEYAALKAGGRWYLTGTGRVPQDAGWGAVARWLDDPTREVVSVRTVTGTVEVWPTPGEQPVEVPRPNGS